MKTYIAKSGRLYKIGKSKDPVKRINALKTGNPNIRLIAFGEGVSEKTLHFRFRRNRQSGEWFKFRHKDVEKIIGLLCNEYHSKEFVLS